MGYIELMELCKKVFKMGWSVKNSVTWQNLVILYEFKVSLRYLICKKICNMFIMYLTGPNLHYHFRNIKFHQKLDI